jgi:uncharacterized protein
MNKKKLINILKNAGCSDAVITHSKKVHTFAMTMAQRLEEKGRCINTDLVSTGALLHDIGRSRTHGIRHAVEGADIARTLGFPDTVISIIENHIGAGIGKDEALQLGLPPKNYIPKTLEEEIVAHADNLTETLDINQLINRVKNDGYVAGAQRLKKLHQKLEQLCEIDFKELLWSKLG